MITLPEKNSDVGAEARLLLAECPGPGLAGYTLDKAKGAMQLMDAVLRNRLLNPGPFLAKGAKYLRDIIKAKGQFAGFEGYPLYNNGIRQNIQSALNIANDPKDKRHEAYTGFINAAIDIANSTMYSDPSPGKLSSWRTAGSSSPGKTFQFYKSVFGNDFYYLK